jgi:hypothetical protein
MQASDLPSRSPYQAAGTLIEASFRVLMSPMNILLGGRGVVASALLYLIYITLMCACQYDDQLQISDLANTEL